jgi:hypothetical protein
MVHRIGTDPAGVRGTLTMLWIFVLFNYLYCDVIGLMDPDLLGQYLTGDVAGMTITPMLLVGASLLMEIPIAMVLLTGLLRPTASRRANVAAGTVMTVVQTGTLFLTPPTPYYLLFSIVEIGTTVAIIVLALRRPTGPGSRRADRAGADPADPADDDRADADRGEVVA